MYEIVLAIMDTWKCNFKGNASDVVVEIFVRAKTRKEAKEKVREYLPNARFYC